MKHIFFEIVQRWPGKPRRKSNGVDMAKRAVCLVLR